eukprot:2543884-Pleurochrysis_carterae.AAC.1
MLPRDNLTVAPDVTQETTLSLPSPRSRESFLFLTGGGEDLVRRGAALRGWLPRQSLRRIVRPAVTVRAMSAPALLMPP